MAQRIQKREVARRLADRMKVDEATASLDVTAEREVTRALHELPSSITLVIIAHRRSALAASKTPAKRTRYEFVIFFAWKEPVGEDTKAAK